MWGYIITWTLNIWSFLHVYVLGLYEMYWI